ncbi:MAG: 2-oxo acid dehydrogenase subunit E2 [Planctomycetota bacterium]|nr:2-oxo acid dehydrogenase subunit E2 [Planctomycetota bacterium]
MAQEIIIPRLGWSMEEGTFVAWLKSEGDFVKRGDALFELEGEKATQEIEAVDEGVLRIPLTGPKPGSVHKVGAIIGYLVGANDSIPALANPSQQTNTEVINEADSVVASPSVRQLARKVGIQLSQVKGTGPRGRILQEDVHQAKSILSENAQEPVISNVSKMSSQQVASPRARRLASSLGIDWKLLIGSGSGGRIRECDVKAASTNLPSPITAAGKAQRIPISKKRRLIAQRLVASRQLTVPVTLTTKADATNLVNLRNQFKSTNGTHPIPSFQDIITKLVAEVLKEHMFLAGRWDEDAIVLPAHHELDIGMAVDTEDGLLVPVIRNVAGLTLRDVAVQSKSLVQQAREGKITAAQMQGGVFTITNLGAFGIDSFTPVINYPEAAILGLGAIRKEPVFLDDGQVVAQLQLALSLTFDHRIVDGAPAARFLQSLVSAISNPSAFFEKS